MPQFIIHNSTFIIHFDTMKPTNRFSILAAFAFFVAVFTVPATAQVALGVRAGGNFATVNATETLDKLAPDFKYTPGFDLAGVAEINFGRYFALQPELHWTQKGFRFAETFDVPVGRFNVPAGADATFRTNYLELPVLAKLKLGNDLVQAYAAAGPSVGYAMNAKLVTRPRLFIEFDPINTPVNGGTYVPGYGVRGGTP